MAAILRKVSEGYVYLFDDLADQRLRSWPFMGKPIQVFGLLTLYYMFVTKWGPNWMENKKPFQLKKILIMYNIIQIFFCAYIFIECTLCTSHYKWICEPVDYSNSEKAVRMAKICYAYFVTKILDLLDTVFFVLRKKHSQISFLHIYHHMGMVLLMATACTFLAGGHGYFIGYINAFIHVLMYSYYLVAVVRPTMKHIEWVKKTITQLQIVQFFCIAVHLASSLLPAECGYPRWIAVVLLPHNIFFVVLFTDFYIKTYVKKPKRSLQPSTVINENKISDDIKKTEVRKVE